MTFRWRGKHLKPDWYYRVLFFARRCRYFLKTGRWRWIVWNDDTLDIIADLSEAAEKTERHKR